MLGSYLFPKMVGTGQFEILGKFAAGAIPRRLDAVDADYDQKTTEINLNYVIKQFNARVMIFYQGHALRRRADRTSSRSASACRCRCEPRQTSQQSTIVTYRHFEE